MTLKELWSIMRGRQTNFRCANASWTHYPDGDPAGRNPRWREKMKLPKGHTELSKDPRPIASILWPNDPAEPHFKVGRSGITSIEAYDECGSMSHVPWLAVSRGDEGIILRVPADHVAISYAA